MDDTVDALQQKMAAAAASLDFEAARRYRDRFTLMRGGASFGEAKLASTTHSMRQVPGGMGLGTGLPRIVPPENWTPPVKPDPLTSNQGAARGRPARNKP